MQTLFLKNLDININSGDLISVIGPNGCGKTILLKMLSGKIKNDNIFIDNKNINTYNLEYKKNNIVCIFDDNIYKTNNPLSELNYYLDILDYSDSEKNSRVDFFIDYFKLGDLININFENLNISNRIFIKILSLLIIEPSIIAIDDLITYLNQDMKTMLFNYLNLNNITLISVTSNMEELLLYDKVLIMNKGKKKLFDSTNNVLKREDIFNELGLNLPFIHDINSMLKSYDLIDRDHFVYKELVDVLWK